MVLRIKVSQQLATTKRHVLIVLMLPCILPLVGLAGYRILERNKPVPVLPAISTPLSAYQAAVPRLRTVLDTFRRNENITDALARHGLSRQQILDLVQTTRSVYNLSKIVAGREFKLGFWSSNGEFNDFNYAIDDDRYLTVYRAGDRFVPLLKNFEYEIHADTVTGVIQDSLFLTLTNIGEQEQFAVDLAEIFTWDVDFYTDIQNGDSFRVLVEKKYLGGEFFRYGKILAAELVVQKKRYDAFRFENAYFDSNGRSLRKSLLKSPLKFTRISSRYSSARRHPILKVVRPHYGVDYAAPAGTPVVAIAAGRVISAGWDGGLGKSVRVRHDGGLESIYSHLSSIVVGVGEKMTQGELIGLVGATGLATGPHLDFRLLQNNRYTNPTKRIVPAGQPVAPAQLARFMALRDELRNRLDQLALNVSDSPRTLTAHPPSGESAK